MNADCWRVENRRGGGGGPVGAACYMTALQTTSNQTRNQTPPFKTSLFWTFTNSSDIRKKIQRKQKWRRRCKCGHGAAGTERSNKFREWGTGVEVDRQQENRPRTVCEMLDGMFVSSTRFQFLSVPVSKVWSTRKGWGVRQVEGIEKAAFKAFINHFTPVFIF